MSTNRYLLFCSTGLGDSLFCTPAIRHLRTQDPAGEITIVTKDKIRNLFETNAHLNRIVSYRNNFFSMWRARRSICASDYRAIFLFHVGGEVVRLFRGARFGELHCVQQLRDLPPGAKVYPIDIREKRQWEDFADMVALVCGGKNTNHEFEIPLDARSDAQAEAYFANFPEAALRVGLQLGGSHLGKCWPPERFAALANHLAATRDVQLFINATRKEELLWEQFNQHLSPQTRARVHRLPGTSIVGLAALLKRLSLFVTNDTGPLHVALSQQVPVIALKAHDEKTFAYTLPRPTPLRRPIFVRTDLPTSGPEYQQSHRAMECIPVTLVINETEAVLRALENP